MGIYTNFVCENAREKNCKVMPLNFEAPQETWQDLLDFAKSQGWTLEGDPMQVSMKCWCPDCAKI